MAKTRTHAGEVETSAALVGRLVAAQFPQWADLPIVPVASYGTDHDIYRLGDALSARLPRLDWASGQAALEAAWLPRLAPHLPLAVPVQVAMGRPALGYPFAWSVYEWLPGAPVDPVDPAIDLHTAATDLAAFVTALRGISTVDAPARTRGSRGAPLADRDADVRRAIAGLADRIDAAAALRSWQVALDAPPWPDRDVWLHGDLMPGNLLAERGRLRAVIDFGSLTVGDPAADLLPAWNLFDTGSRAVYRQALATDDATWQRGRGWALCQAVMALSYYWTTNPGMVRQAGHTLSRLLTER